MDFDLDVEGLIGSVLKGTLTGRRKKTRGVRRLLGKRGGLLNTGTLLALAGVAWGVYETMQNRPGQVATGPPLPQGSPAPGNSWAPPGGTASGPAPGTIVPPPLPVAGGTGPAAASPASAPSEGAVPEGVLRVIRLTLSAARADGTLSDAERESILGQARQAGVEAIIARELDSPMPLAHIVAGVTDAAQRADLYTLAFAIVRADEAVSGSERVYLAQLAHQLGLDPRAVATLEENAARRIDQAASEE